LALQREAKTTEAAYFGQATIEALPLAGGAVDLVLCRDMLLHVEHLEKGLAECSRVLRPGGSMIVLATMAGAFLSQAEAPALFGVMGILPGNLVRERLEAAYRQAGLAIHEMEIIAGERLEYWEEEGAYYSRELIRLARMRRAPERCQEELGAERFQMAMAL